MVVRVIRFCNTDEEAVVVKLLLAIRCQGVLSRLWQCCGIGGWLSHWMIELRSMYKCWLPAAEGFYVHGEERRL